MPLNLWHIFCICSGLLRNCIFPRIIVFLLVYFVTHFLYFLSWPFLLLVTRTFRTLLILALFVFVLRMKTIYSIQKSSFMERTHSPHDEKCNRTDSERWNFHEHEICEFIVGYAFLEDMRPNVFSEGWIAKVFIKWGIVFLEDERISAFYGDGETWAGD